MLKTYLLIKNHNKTIEDCLRSLQTLPGPVIVGDIGSMDGTADICRRLGAQVVDLDWKEDYADAKNRLMEADDGWKLWVEPWERLAKGHETIKRVAAGPDAAYQLQVLQADTLTKDTRLWKGPKTFYNPVYETVGDETATLDAFLVSRPKTDYDEQARIIERWKAARPTAPEPHYYHSFVLLAQKRFVEYLSVAEHFLFCGKAESPLLTTRYYMAMVQLYVNGDGQAAIKSLLPSLTARPLMAEWWCLLGDIYYKSRRYEKAKVFYENAITLGSRRLSDDPWPLEIPKYGEYPKKMIASCDQIIADTKIYRGRDES